MGKNKPQIKNLAKTAREQEGGDFSNRIVFTMFCKNIVNTIQEQVPKKPASIKQIVTFSLLSMDESTKREIVQSIQDNKKFDRILESFITNNKKKITEFFEKQKDKEQSVAYLKKRVEELEQKVAK